MQTIFLDANVLVSVLNKEYPAYSHCAKVLSLADNPRFKVYTSAICLAIACYFSTKKSGRSEAQKKIATLAEKLSIASCGENEVRLAAADKKVLDYEDGLEYYAALNAGCRHFITADTGDFHFASIEVLDAEAFLRKHLL